MEEKMSNSRGGIQRGGTTKWKEEIFNKGPT